MIKNIKFGFKIWSSNYHLVEAVGELIKRDVFDYLELLVVPDTNIFLYKKIKAPYIIHISHESFGLNIADEKKEKHNLELINNSINWADELKAKYLILHPGFGKLETALNFLKKIKDRRIIIENMPKRGLERELMIGFSVGEVKKLMTDKFGFCLDFGHAATLRNYKEEIKKFLKLKPKMFHISDGFSKNEIDEHLDIGKGDYDIKFLIDCIKRNRARLVTLETPKSNLNSIEEDLENIKKLKQLC